MEEIIYQIVFRIFIHVFWLQLVYLGSVVGLMFKQVLSSSDESGKGFINIDWEKLGEDNLKYFVVWFCHSNFQLINTNTDFS